MEASHGRPEGDRFEVKVDLRYFVFVRSRHELGLELNPARRHRISHMGEAAPFLQGLLRRQSVEERR